MTVENELSRVRQNPWHIRNITDPSEELQLAAVEQNGNIIQHIANPTERVQLVAIKKIGYRWALPLIQNPTAIVQMMAVQREGGLIRFIENPSERVQLAAVQQDAWSIRYIKNPSERVQLAAIEKNSDIIMWINNVSPTIFKNQQVKVSILRVILAAIKTGDVHSDPTDIIEFLRTHDVKWPELDTIEAALIRGSINESQWRNVNDDSEEEKIAFVARYPENIKYISNPSERVQLAAVNRYPYVIEYIDNPSERLQLAAVSKSGWVIKDIYNKGIVPSDQVQLAAVKQDADAIMEIPNPSELIQLAAVQRAGHSIKHIKNPSERIQLAAIEQEPFAIKHIKNPSIEIQLVAVKKWGGVITDIKQLDTRIFSDNEVKKSILKYLLRYLSQDKNQRVTEFINTLRSEYQIDWPELAKIEAVLERTPLTESHFDPNQMSEEEQIKYIQSQSNQKNSTEDPRITKIKNPSERVKEASVLTLPWSILYIPDASEGLTVSAVQKDIELIRLIPRPSEELQIAAVRHSRYALGYIKNPSERVQIETILHSDGEAIQGISNPSERVQLAAVQQNGYLIRYIENPTVKVKAAAIIQNPAYVRLVIDPEPSIFANPKVKEAVLGRLSKLVSTQQFNIASNIFDYLTQNQANWPELTSIEEQILEMATRTILKQPSMLIDVDIPNPKIFANPEVKQAVIRAMLIQLKSGSSVDDYLNYLAKHQVDWPEIPKIIAATERTKITESRNLNSMSEEEQLAAVQQNGLAIKHINTPSLQVQLAAVQQDGWAIRNIDTPSLQVQLAAVQKNGGAIRDIKNPSEKVQLAAVQQNGYTIEYIQNPSLQVQLAAVQQNGRAIWYINTPDPALFVDNQAKRSILKVLLTGLKAGRDISDLISFLESQNVQWPELAKIKAAFERGKLTESVDINSMSEEEQIAAVNWWPFAIREITNPSERVQLSAVRKNGTSIVYIRNPGFRVQLAAVKQQPLIILDIKNPNPALFTRDQVKKLILRAMLIDLKTGEGYDVADVLIYLREQGVSWSELDKIEAVLARKPFDS